jgi:beta-galactosidase
MTTAKYKNIMREICMRNIDLKGDWKFSLDYNKVGIRERWYTNQLEDVIRLPGTTDEAHYGSEVLEKSMGNFTRRYRYDGFACG